MATDDSSPWQTLWWVVGLGLLVGVVWWFATKFLRDVAKAAEEWPVPASPQSEAELRSSLADHLRRSLLPDAAVMEEFGAERSKADIVVLSSSAAGTRYVEKVAIEVKFRLRRKDELARLVGQIVGYKAQQFDKLMVISVDPDPTLHEVLKKRAQVAGLSGYMMVLAK